MPIARQRARAVLVVALFTSICAASLQARAQQVDTNAIFKAMQDHYAREDYPAAQLEAQKYLDATRARVGDDDVDYAAALDHLAMVYKAQRKYGDAEGLFRRALAIREQKLGANHPDVLDTLNSLASLYSDQGKNAEAEDLYRHTLSIRERAFGASDPGVATILNRLAGLYRDQARYADAERLYKRALAIREQALGTNHPDVATTLNALASVYRHEGKYGDAEALYERALAIREKAVDANHLGMAAPLNNLANLYLDQGKYGAAEALQKRALAIRRESLGESHPDVATSFNNLAIVYRAQGRYPEAEDLYQRAITIRERAQGADHPDVATSLNNLANLYSDRARYADAEPFYQRALTINEKALGVGHPNVVQTLNNLATIYSEQGKYADAEALYKRILAPLEQALGVGHPAVAVVMDNLATLYESQDRYAEAEGLCKRSLAIGEKALGANHPAVAEALSCLAVAYEKQGKRAEAERLIMRALAIRTEALGADHPAAADSLTALAGLYMRQGKYAEAEEFYRRAHAIQERAFGSGHPAVLRILADVANASRAQGKGRLAEGLYGYALQKLEQALGASHPDVAFLRENQASFYGDAGDIARALASSRKASAAVIAHAAAERPGARPRSQAAGLVEQRADYFRRHVSYLAAAAREGTEPAAALGREALEIAQWAVHSSAAAAVQQMATRFSSGSGELANLVRESQDMATLWRDKDKALIAALSKPEGQQNRAAIERLRTETAETEERAAAVVARLEREFPEYAALANPRPLKPEDVQQLLGPDEALVFFLTGAKQSYVFALTRDDFEWRTLAIGEKALSDRIGSFRRGLDTVELGRSSETGAPVLFDLDLAHNLFTTLLGPIEHIIKDKHDLLVVPSGSLTALPFHLLVTEKPAAAIPALKDIADYRDAAWLLKRHAVSVLPSVASLRALRVFARHDEGGRPLIGFGDPVFKDEPAPAEAAGATSKKDPAGTRGYADYWSGAGVDRSRLADALPRLEDTAEELKTIATELGVPSSKLYLRTEASETNVKRLPLSDYRVVFFATHALVAGDVKGLGEPSLALTIPSQPTDLDDGLLTASEVAQLKLNAAWVVLSACNTIAGDRPGAEALSGLARAFFYAGARALLVSHWSVESRAATRLTTSTFAIMTKDPGIGRAEAVRRAMLDYMNDRTNPVSAYPAFWAPFSVIGEGARFADQAKAAEQARNAEIARATADLAKQAEEAKVAEMNRAKAAALAKAAAVDQDARTEQPPPAAAPQHETGESPREKTGESQQALAAPAQPVAPTATKTESMLPLQPSRISASKSRHIAFMPDSNFIAVRGDEGILSTHDSETGALLRQSKIGIGPSGMAISPNGTRVAATVYGDLYVFTGLAREDADTRLLWKAGIPAGCSGDALAYSPDGRMIAATHPRSALRIYEAETGRLIREIPGRDHRKACGIHAAVFTPDSRYLLTSTLRLWEVSTGRLVRTLTGADPWNVNDYNEISLSADGRRVALLTEKHVGVWSLETGKPLWTAPNHDPDILGGDLAYTRDDRFVITARGRHIRVYDAKTGRVLQSLTTVDDTLSLAVSSDSRRMLSTHDGPDRIWQISESYR